MAAAIEQTNSGHCYVSTAYQNNTIPAAEYLGKVIMLDKKDGNIIQMQLFEIMLNIIGPSEMICQISVNTVWVKSVHNT